MWICVKREKENFTFISFLGRQTINDIKLSLATLKFNEEKKMLSVLNSGYYCLTLQWNEINVIFFCLHKHLITIIDKCNSEMKHIWNRISFFFSSHFTLNHQRSHYNHESNCEKRERQGMEQKRKYKTLEKNSNKKTSTEYRVHHKLPSGIQLVNSKQQHIV